MAPIELGETNRRDQAPGYEEEKKRSKRTQRMETT